jgi:hypothetical protein
LNKLAGNAKQEIWEVNPGLIAIEIELPVGLQIDHLLDMIFMRVRDQL